MVASTVPVGQKVGLGPGLPLSPGDAVAPDEPEGVVVDPHEASRIASITPLARAAGHGDRVA